MHIVSYRGPGQAGGVSTALARAWNSSLGEDSLWWHIDGYNLSISSGRQAQPSHLASIPKEVIAGHYRFCNEFLWPVMHDLPQYARYVPDDRVYYETFNATYGWCLVRSISDGLPADFFVQDYQLALLPVFLRENAGFRSLVFWHIPWPKQIAPEYVQHIAAIARGLLNTEAVGFHTQEYADNFLSFIEQYLDEFSTSRDSLTVWPQDRVARMAPSRRSMSDRYRILRQSRYESQHMTQIVVAPLGIDADHWSSLAVAQRNTMWHPALVRTPFILSVDRADYTKGVTDRIQALDIFFERHPEWVGQVVLAQICGKTRAGLQSFDNYWLQCQALYSHLKQRWATDTWQPLIWIESSFSNAELALVYRMAAAMVVNPIRDGLNLTAKEYVACQPNATPGVLTLSDGAGVWQELGGYSLLLQPGNPAQIAEGIYQALTMDTYERAWRMTMLKELVRSNTLSYWWHTFSALLESPVVDQPANYGLLKETS